MSIVDLVAAIYLYLHDVKTACSGYMTSYFICTSAPIFCHHYQKPGPIIKKRISRFGGCFYPVQFNSKMTNIQDLLLLCKYRTRVAVGT